MRENDEEWWENERKTRRHKNSHPIIYHVRFCLSINVIFRTIYTERQTERNRKY